MFSEKITTMMNNFQIFTTHQIYNDEKHKKNRFELPVKLGVLSEFSGKEKIEN